MTRTTNAADLRFVDTNRNVEISYEVERWNTNGDSFIWVSIPALTGTGTTIRAYWGNRQSTTIPDYTTNGFTWSNGFGAVWHMNETVLNDGLQRDSTTNGNSARFIDVNGDSSAGTTGLIGGGNHFSGSSDYLTVANSPSISPTNAITLEIMARSDSPAWNDHGFLMSKHGAYLIHPSANETLVLFMLTDANGGNHQPGYRPAEITNWHYYAVTYDGAVQTVYFDGQPVATAAFSGGITNDPGSLAMGNDNRFNNSRYMIGSLDEARVSTVSRSTNWIWACWMSEMSNSFFNSFDKVIKAPERGTVIRIH